MIVYGGLSTSGLLPLVANITNKEYRGCNFNQYEQEGNLIPLLSRLCVMSVDHFLDILKDVLC